MELTKEQKYKIFLEEKERLKKEQEQQERDLIDSLTPEEKQNIVEEIEARNTVYVTEKDLLYPDEKQTKKYIILIALAAMSLFIHVFIGAIFLISVISYYVYLGITHKMIMDPNVKYYCPKCDHEHINIIRVEEKNEQERTGSIKATCFSCNQEFRLAVDKVVLQKMNIS